MLLSRSLRLPTTKAALDSRALSVRDELIITPEIFEIDKERMRLFTASKAWEIRLVQRHSLQFSTLHGEAGSVCAATVLKEMIEVRH